MDKLPVNVKKPHNQDLCSMCQKLGRKCTGLVEEDVSDEEKTKLDEPTHRVIRKDGFEFKVRGGFAGGRAGLYGRGRGGFRGGGFGDNGDSRGGSAESGFGRGSSSCAGFGRRNFADGFGGGFGEVNSGDGFGGGFSRPSSGRGSGRGHRNSFMPRSGLEGRKYSGGIGIEDDDTGANENKSNDYAFLVVYGLPRIQSRKGISKEDVEDFLLDEIPGAEDVRIVAGFGGNRAWVRIKLGADVANVLRLYRHGIQFNGKFLDIEELKITQEVFETVDKLINDIYTASDDDDYSNNPDENEYSGQRFHFTSGGGRGRGFNRSIPRGGTLSRRARDERYLENDSTDSDASIDNLGVGFSGLGFDDRKPVNVRAARINSVSSARSLRSNSESGFGRDINSNFVGDRDGNGDIMIASDISILSSISSDYEADKDPERYHW